MNLDQFHTTDKKGNLTGVFDFKIFTFLKEKLQLIVIGGNVYIYKGGCFHLDTGGSELKTEIRKLIYPQFVKSTTVKRIFDLFLMDAEIQERPENLNQFPVHWIPFRNGFYDPVERCMMPHSPVYKCVNQIPHDYDPSAKLTGRLVDEWLEFIAPNEEDREMLLQYIGLCMTADTRQQKFMILCGTGGSGKSTLIKMIENAIGTDNISNISLKELTQRFASFGLMGKLLNSCADLEVTALEDVSLLKKILGEDSIRAEPKGKDAFSFKSYAKLIFSTNELPLILNEKSNGFYRRLMVLKMDRQPVKAEADFFDRLQAETDYFIQRCVKALQRMYQQGGLSVSSNSQQAVQTLRNDSDTVEAWLNEACILDEASITAQTALYHSYELYCDVNDRTPLKVRSFYKSLESKGYYDIKTTIDGKGGTVGRKGISLK